MIKTDYCARCCYLRIIKVNSREHFFCQNKRREITSDNIQDCKSFIYQRNRNPKLEEQFEKDLELLYNLPDKKDT